MPTVHIDAGSPHGEFTVRTASTRRWLVIDIPSKTTVKRSDSYETARKVTNQNLDRRILVDSLHDRHTAPGIYVTAEAIANSKAWRSRSKKPQDCPYCGYPLASYHHCSAGTWTAATVKTRFEE